MILSTSHPIYSEILDKVTDAVERQIFDILAAHPGEQVRREQLIKAIFGRDVPRRELGR